MAKWLNRCAGEETKWAERHVCLRGGPQPGGHLVDDPAQLGAECRSGADSQLNESDSFVHSPKRKTMIGSNQSHQVRRRTCKPLDATSAGNGLNGLPPSAG